MFDFVYILDGYSDMSGICNDLGSLLRVVGIALKLIQYVVPILLILFGGLDFAKAVIGKDEKEMKEAQKKFMTRAIVALCVFLIIPIVSVLMRLVSGDGYEECMTCIKSPFSGECKSTLD